MGSKIILLAVLACWACSAKDVSIAFSDSGTEEGEEGKETSTMSAEMDAEGGDDGPAADDGAKEGSCMGASCEAAMECDATQACGSGDFECVDGTCVFQPPERKPSYFLQTLGGGVAAAGSHRVEIAIGAAGPVGVMRGDRYVLQLGPSFQR